MRRVCVYLGSSPGVRPAYAEAAASLARALARRGLGLVYGGASVGTMGVLADAALEAGGEVIGVIPQALQDRELGHRGLTELRVVASMHERKLTMMDLADAFVCLPGGVGTLEELFETYTWLLLGIHDKPIGLLDVGGFWEPLLVLMDRVVEEGFLRRELADRLVVDDDEHRLLDRLGAGGTP